MKQDGCNKIKCSKCGTVQCDVCRKTIQDYTHFNDPNRGGKVGQCPLFDESEGRHEEEVSNAEAQTRKKVVEENPGLVRIFSVKSESDKLAKALFLLPLFQLLGIIKKPAYILTRCRTKKHCASQCPRTTSELRKSTSGQGFWVNNLAYDPSQYILQYLRAMLRT